MLSEADARALVAASPLLDQEWYADQVGHRFASRAAAVTHWVAQLVPDASPHPLFEPAWLYPGGGWRRAAPDPLSAYLSGRRPRSPHPRYPAGELGPLEDWLAEHDAAELLPAPLPRDPVGSVVLLVPTDDLALAVRWVRHLARTHPEHTVSLTPATEPARRILSAVAADRPQVHVGDLPVGEPAVVVEVGPDEPPRWAWLTPLLTALERPGVAAVQPVPVARDLTVAGPVLAGHPVSAVARLEGRTLPGRLPAPEARRTGAEGVRVITTGSWVPGPACPREGAGWDELAAEARRVQVVEGVPSLRWALDIAAGAAPIGRRWGDWHFARSLADALERRGQWVEIDHPETRGRATRAETDVVLTLRGLEPVAPQPGAVSLLWVISHPDDVSAAELAAHDRAFAASTTWAARHGVTPLLQCTDATRFHPGPGSPADQGDPLFVGNARGGMRPVVAAAREAGVAVRVIGTGWAEHGVPAQAERIDNTDLPAAYATAPVVLADHHDDMRTAGFVANRVFDVLAVAGRLLVDDVAGLEDLLASLDAAPGAVPVWRTPRDLARLAAPPYDAWPDDRAREALAHRVVAEHSFDARAATLLQAALDSRP